MIKVGITGGIGSGKTTFCKFWEEQGAFVIYADDLAKELMVSDQELIRAVKDAFGGESYHKEGQLNREYLANEAFSQGRVEELNALVHPVLWKRTKELAEQKRQEGIKVFAEEAAILLNNGRPDWLDYVILVTAPETERVKRVMQRDDTGREQILGRIQKQPDFQSLLPLCDFVVENTGDVQDLKKKSLEIFDLITQKAG